ncbi:MAG: hypothetical protein SFU98_10450 [Leptospiraceae bacterium]|nr:hypothetical protein [Leptospiraceae bacterium]
MLESSFFSLLLILMGGFFLFRNLSFINDSTKLRAYLESSIKGKIWIQKFGIEKTIQISRFLLPIGILMSLLMIGVGIYTAIPVFQKYFSNKNRIIYNKAGLEFEHPEDWIIDDSKPKEEIRRVFIEAPDEGIVILMLFPKSEAKELTEFAKSFSDSTKDNSQSATIQDSEFKNDQVLQNHKTLNEYFLATVKSTSVKHIRIYKRIDFDDKVSFLIAQVSMEDKDSVLNDFDKIFSSVKYNK